jgi:hypothetical protein
MHTMKVLFSAKCQTPVVFRYLATLLVVITVVSSARAVPARAEDHRDAALRFTRASNRALHASNTTSDPAVKHQLYLQGLAYALVACDETDAYGGDAEGDAYCARFRAAVARLDEGSQLTVKLRALKFSESLR